MNKTSCRLVGLLAFIVLALTHGSVEAQTFARSDQPKPETSAPPPKKDSDSSRTDIQDLKAKVDQLLMIVERQQRAMSEMEKRLNSVETRPQNATPTPAALKTGDVAGVAESNDANTALAVSSVPKQSSAQPLEERMKKYRQMLSF